ncbi:MAG: ATP synthase F1 subunit delta [Acidimicrobiales bacterium]
MTATMGGGSPARVDGYATGLLEVAKAEDSLDRVVDELFRFARALDRSDELRQSLTDIQLPPEKRQAIVEDLLDKRVSPLTVAMVSFIVGTGRSRDIVPIIDKLVERSASERERELAEVRSATPLDREVQERLQRALSRALGKEVEVKVIVDPSVMGGLVAKVGDTVIDGSVRHKLERLKETL